MHKITWKYKVLRKSVYLNLFIFQTFFNDECTGGSKKQHIK